MSQAETKTPSTNHPSGRGVNIWHQRHQQYPATLLFLHFKEGEPMKEASFESIRNLFSERYWFRNWPNPTVQAVAAGVYVVWQGDQLIYAGMSGRQIEKNLGKKKYGLVTRLDSHANGRLSGDQFNVYVANRLVIPGLVPSQLPRFANGSLTLDLLTRQYIHQHFQYQYLIVDHSKEAFTLEKKCQGGEIFGQKPLLNPL